MYVNFKVKPEDLTAQVRELAKIVYAAGSHEHILWPLLEVLHDHLGISCDTSEDNGYVVCPNDCADWETEINCWCACGCHAV